MRSEEQNSRIIFLDAIDVLLALLLIASIATSAHILMPREPSIHVQSPASNLSEEDAARIVLRELRPAIGGIDPLRR